MAECPKDRHGRRINIASLRLLSVVGPTGEMGLRLASRNLAFNHSLTAKIGLLYLYCTV